MLRTCIGMLLKIQWKHLFFYRGLVRTDPLSSLHILGPTFLSPGAPSKMLKVVLLLPGSWQQQQVLSGLESFLCPLFAAPSFVSVLLSTQHLRPTAA